MKVLYSFVLTVTGVVASTPVVAAVLIFDCTFDEICVPSEGCEASNLQLEFNVDANDGTAFLTGNNGLAEVQFVNGSDGGTFLETLSSGAVQTTTMDSIGNSVHSRHTIISGRLLPSQYSGTCRTFKK